MRIETFHEFNPYLSGDIVNLTLVEVLGNANHGIGNQGTLRVSRCKCDVGLESIVESLCLLVSLSQFVLGVGGKGMLGKVSHDRLVSFDRLVPFLELL